MACACPTSSSRKANAKENQGKFICLSISKAKAITNPQIRKEPEGKKRERQKLLKTSRKTFSHKKILQKIFQKIDILVTGFQNISGYP